MIRVRIPATSANLGSGFDALGIALSLYNEIEVEEHDSLEIAPLDNVKIPTDASNLVYRSMQMLYTHCGKKLRGISIKQRSPIPFARGLGSSSACVIGGLVAANHLLGEPLSKEELLYLAAKTEGHPDNVAPALLGGMVAAVIENENVWYIKEELQPDLRFLVIVPNMELKTSAARAALPHVVPFQDACFNLARSALMVGSLAQGKYENLRYAAADRLHQPYRLRLIPYGAEVLQECYNLGAYAATVSGSGSTLLAMVGTDSRGIEEELQQYLYRKDLLDWKMHVLDADNQGTLIVSK